VRPPVDGSGGLAERAFIGQFGRVDHLFDHAQRRQQFCDFVVLLLARETPRKQAIKPHCLGKLRCGGFIGGNVLGQFAQFVLIGESIQVPILQFPIPLRLAHCDPPCPARRRSIHSLSECLSRANALNAAAAVNPNCSASSFTPNASLYRNFSRWRDFSVSGLRQCSRASASADNPASWRSKASRMACTVSGGNGVGVRPCLSRRWRIFLAAIPRAHAPNDRSASYSPNFYHNTTTTSWKISSRS